MNTKQSRVVSAGMAVAVVAGLLAFFNEYAVAQTDSGKVDPVRSIPAVHQAQLSSSPVTDRSRG